MSERLGIYSELELQAARRLVRETVRAIRGFRLYEGGDHPTLQGMLRELRKKWDEATAGGPLSLRLTEKAVLLADGVVHRSESRSEVLPTLLYDHGVVGLVLKRGLGAKEARRLIGVLSEEPDGHADYASLLWEADLQHAQVLLDVDDYDEEDEAKTPEDFARQVAEMGDADDPPVLTEFQREREELTERVARIVSGGSDVRESGSGSLTELERGLVARLRLSDDFVDCVRHALRVVHHMAGNDCSEREVEVVEKSVVSLMTSLAGSGDLDGVTDALCRARTMAASENPLRMRTGELTTAAFQEPPVLKRFLQGLDRLEELEAPRLAECLGQLLPSSALTVARWLPETQHPEAAALAMRVYGDAAVDVLVPLYEGGDRQTRERIAPALLEIGTPEAVEALAAEFDQLPEQTRLELVHVGQRSQETSVRTTVLRALRDPSAKVRRAAVGALRRPDAPEIARLLPQLLEEGVFDRVDKREAKGFFDMLARIGDGEVARVLMDQCLPKSRLTLRKRRLTLLQHLCLKALRDMRSPDARPIVDELRAKGSRAMRDILDDPLAGLE